MAEFIFVGKFPYVDQLHDVGELARVLEYIKIANSQCNLGLFNVAGKHEESRPRIFMDKDGPQRIDNYVRVEMLPCEQGINRFPISRLLQDILSGGEPVEVIFAFVEVYVGEEQLGGIEIQTTEEERAL